jgi:hypothetical protein
MRTYSCLVITQFPEHNLEWRMQHWRSGDANGYAKRSRRAALLSSDRKNLLQFRIENGIPSPPPRSNSPRLCVSISAIARVGSNVTNYFADDLVEEELLVPAKSLLYQC